MSQIRLDFYNFFEASAQPRELSRSHSDRKSQNSTERNYLSTITAYIVRQLPHRTSSHHAARNRREEKGQRGRSIRSARRVRRSIATAIACLCSSPTISHLAGEPDPALLVPTDNWTNHSHSLRANCSSPRLPSLFLSLSPVRVQWTYSLSVLFSGLYYVLPVYFCSSAILGLTITSHLLIYAAYIFAFSLTPYKFNKYFLLTIFTHCWLYQNNNFLCEYFYNKNSLDTCTPTSFRIQPIPADSLVFVYVCVYVCRVGWRELAR